MKLICVSNERTPPYFSGKSTRLSVTVGKVYDGTTDEWNNFSVRNDNGIVNTYSTRIFMPLDEWRRKKLKEIGI